LVCISERWSWSASSLKKSWRAFWLVVCEIRRPSDVAAELQISLNAVYLAKSRVLHALRETLGETNLDRE
jgi:hypothetical protein